MNVGLGKIAEEPTAYLRGSRGFKRDYSQPIEAEIALERVQRFLPVYCSS